MSGAVSSAIAPLVAGVERTATVVGVARSAAYLQLGTVKDSQGAGPVLLALTTHDAVRVPNAVVIASRPGAAILADLGTGMRAQVGSNQLRVANLTIETTSTWAAARPRFPEARRALARATELDQLVSRTLPALPGYLEQPVARLRNALRVCAVNESVSAASGLLGLGPGLTPSGDDIVAAVLVALRALPPTGAPLDAVADAIAEVVTASAVRRTSSVSANLLSHAAVGYCVPQLSDLLTALGRPGPPASLNQPLRALLKVGHHSGGDLARGIALTLRAAALQLNGTDPA